MAKVLVLSRGPSNSWLSDVLGFHPEVLELVTEDWQLFDALADGGYDVVVVDPRGAKLAPAQLVAMVRTTGRETPFVIVGDGLRSTRACS